MWPSVSIRWKCIISLNLTTASEEQYLSFQLPDQHWLGELKHYLISVQGKRNGSEMYQRVSKSEANFNFNFTCREQKNPPQSRTIAFPGTKIGNISEQYWQYEISSQAIPPCTHLWQYLIGQNIGGQNSRKWLAAENFVRRKGLSAENFVRRKGLSAKRFCPLKYFVNQNSKHVKLI